ncbi:MAG: tryptophan synthase subunit alpha [Myxococcota bacterium]
MRLDSTPLTEALRAPQREMALVAYVVAGYPSRAAFPDVLSAVAQVADAIEVGVPFTDPMADGVSIQRASEAALADGTDLPYILETVANCSRPVALMGYLNPFLAGGPDLASDLASANVRALIVPDLPLEERDVLDGVPLVQLVTPLTPEGRIGALCDATAGFIYAVTGLSTTGTKSDLHQTPDTLARIRPHAQHPVLAGFGIRSATQVRALRGLCDGVIVGSALVDAIGRDEDPVDTLNALHA